VQAAIGAMVMLVTSLLNRVMVVEYALAAAIPGALVGWHYAVQLSRPLWGHRADGSAQRTPWVLTGLGILALGTLVAVDATLFMGEGRRWPLLLAIAGYTMIGLGVGMAGTALLALLASRTSAERKPAAAAICWTMMVAGIVVAAATGKAFLDPFSPARLAIFCSLVALGAFLLALAALHRVEASSTPVPRAVPPLRQPFADTLRDIWADRQARQFTGFVFISMLAYSMQDLILEPFAGLVFGMTPGESTGLAGIQHQGILLGMLVAGAGGSVLARRFGPRLKLWITGGCLGSALMLASLSAGAMVGPGWPIEANVFGLGVANGVFAVAAVGAMLGLASDGKGSGEGARMGVWGAAQAVAFGLGGFLGAVLVDGLRARLGDDGAAFQAVFGIEAALFIFAAMVAVGTRLTRARATGGVVAA
jgi:MFS transporter, BCD family, chlorophyll transporter